jgi:hypothetical protein
MTRWYVDPSTRDLVVRRDSGVSSSIQADETMFVVVEIRRVLLRRLRDVIAG